MALALEDYGSAAAWNQGVTVSITVPSNSNCYLVVMLQYTNGFQSIKYAGVDFPTVESYIVAGIINCRMCGIIPTSGTNDLVIVDTGGNGEQGHLIWALFTGVSQVKPIGAKTSNSSSGSITTDITTTFNNSITLEGQFLYPDAYTLDVVQDSSQTEIGQIISSPRGLASAIKSQPTAGTQTLAYHITRLYPASIYTTDAIWEIVDANEVSGGSFLPFL